MPNQSKNPALFLLALLQNGNATMRLGAGTLEIGPVDIAKKLAPKIREHKASLVRLLLQLDCAECGSVFKQDGRARFDGKNWLQGLKCENGHQAVHSMPDFPVYDKTGKEI